MGLPLNIVIDVQKPQADKKTEEFIHQVWVGFVCLFVFISNIPRFIYSILHSEEMIF